MIEERLSVTEHSQKRPLSAPKVLGKGVGYIENAPMYEWSKIVGSIPMNLQREVRAVHLMVLVHPAMEDFWPVRTCTRS
jgi:hypothetical protein